MLDREPIGIDAPPLQPASIAAVTQTPKT